MYLLTLLTLVVIGPYLPTAQGRPITSSAVNSPAISQSLTKIAVYRDLQACRAAAAQQQGDRAWREQEVMNARVQIVASCIPVDGREAVAP